MLDLSENNLAKFPWAYFDKNSFYELEYVNVNFNPSMEIPEQCSRYAYCLKRTLIDNE